MKGGKLHVVTLGFKDEVYLRASLGSVSHFILCKYVFEVSSCLITIQTESKMGALNGMLMIETPQESTLFGEKTSASVTVVYVSYVHTVSLVGGSIF